MNNILVLNHEYLLGSFCFFILVIYLIIPTPEIVFKINNTLKNIKEHKCTM